MGTDWITIRVLGVLVQPKRGAKPQSADRYLVRQFPGGYQPGYPKDMTPPPRSSKERKRRFRRSPEL
jgi:hypothetical protein